MSNLRLGLCFSPGLPSTAPLGKRLTSCHVLLFPELFNGGYAALAEGAAPLFPSDACFQAFRSISKKGKLTCIAGSAFVRDLSGRRTNSCFVYSRGRTIHRYDKIHLFGPAGDRRFFSPGRSLSTFSIPAGNNRVRAGVIICYDLRFPEIARLLAAKGIQVLFVPARWPAARDDAWQTLLKARALENQIFVAGCNSLDEEGGYSYVYDPLGKCLWSNNRGPLACSATVALDLDRIHAAKALHQNLRDAQLLRGLKIASPFSFSSHRR